MKQLINLFLFVLLFFNFHLTFAQSPCDPNGIHPFCTEDNPYGITYNTATSGSADDFLGPYGYACLYAYPAPAYYYLRISTPGDLLIFISQTSVNDGMGLDVDFACWGPFQANTQEQFIQNLCSGVYQLSDIDMGNHRPTNGYHNPNDPSSWGGYPAGNVVDCSFDAAATEWCYIPHAQVGEFYLLLLTNFSLEAGRISFNRESSSTATTDCSLLAPASNNGPLCVGETLYLTCHNSQPGATYAWTGPNGWTSNVQNPIIPNVDLSMAGEYTVTMVYDGETAVASTTVVITVAPNVVVTPSVQSICDGGSATFTASGGDTYLWSTGETSSTLTVSPTTTTVYTVTVTANGGCSATATVTVQYGDFANISLPASVCSGTRVTVTPNVPGYTYSWNTGETSPTIMPIVTVPTIYTVTVTDANGCTARDSVLVTPTPTASFIVDRSFVEINDGQGVVNFTNTSENGDIWHWNFGDVGAAGNHSTEMSPSYNYTHSGIYTVSLVVSTNDGCKDSTSHVITVENPFAFYIPNAFTPNVNGLNEVFKPSGIGVSPNNYEMFIYDSYGELIYYTTELYGEWDGKAKGKLVPADTYIYHFIIESLDGFQRKYTGTVTVIR